MHHSSLSSVGSRPTPVQCRSCKEFKSLSQFGTNPKGVPYRDRCLACKSDSNRKPLSELDPNTLGRRTRNRQYTTDLNPRPRKQPRKGEEKAFRLFRDGTQPTEQVTEGSPGITALQPEQRLQQDPTQPFRPAITPLWPLTRPEYTIRAPGVSSLPRGFTTHTFLTPPSSQESESWRRAELHTRGVSEGAQQPTLQYSLWKDHANRFRVSPLPIYQPETEEGFIHIDEINTPPASQHETTDSDDLSVVELPDGFTPTAFLADRHDLGPMDRVCRFCRARFWTPERTGGTDQHPMFGRKCCSNGEVVRDRHQGLPNDLIELLTGSDPQCREFKKNVRRYNAALAFGSMQFEDRHTLDLGGPIPVGLHGAIYHRIRGYDPADSEAPRYAQLYFHDIESASATRANLFGGLNLGILRRLGAILMEENPFAQAYLTARDKYLALPEDTRPISVGITCDMRVVVRPDDDNRVANAPTSDEIGGLIPTEFAPTNERMVVLARRSADGRPSLALIRVPCTHSAYMPLMYPLLYPRGDLSWNPGVLRRADTDRRITLLEFFRYEVNIRFYRGALRGTWPTPHGFGRLFQQWAVDVWATIDQNKVDYYREHQANLRSDDAEAVQAAIERGEVDGARIGRRVHLPKSHIGCWKFILECYRNSMAIVAALGKPSLFITFTANPKWPEIIRELLPGQDATDRPDLVVRVFNEKAEALRRDLKENGIFGRWAGHVWTIEYQKRGLPHMHLLLFLRPSDRNRLTRPEVIDRIISAELPRPEDDPDGRLRETIHTTMLHGPCGARNPNAPCMKDKQGQPSSYCQKGYPKAFREETQVEEDGYPQYRRRNDGRIYSKRVSEDRTIEFDNSWVVPYNPYLSRKYNAHINVEVCVTIKSVKYIHKYVYKGSDRATINVQHRVGDDECAQYIECRYIGPTEALWRVFEFPVHEEKPAVLPLQVHTPGGHRLTWNARETLTNVAEKERLSRTQLTAFFEYNLRNSDGRHLAYHEFPKEFTWRDKERVWSPRQRGEQIGRMYWFHPRDGEVFYLRLLLTRVHGPTSFEDLRTVHGTRYPTFRAACVALGLLTDDEQWHSCFRDARVWVTGHSSRILFVTALIHGEVTDPVKLWTEFAPDLCDDLLRQLERDRIQYPHDLSQPEIDYGLYLIHRQLLAHNRALADFGLPQPTWPGWAAEENGNQFLQTERSYNTEFERAEAEKLEEGLNEGQRQAFNTILRKVETNPNAAHFFLQGPAGTGKTYLYRALCHRFRALGKVVLCVASSGIAALLLPGGSTAHSRFKIPLDVSEEALCGVSKGSALAALFTETDLIIWDEVPMQDRGCFEAVDRMLRDIRDKPNALFGGIPTIFGGDFAQILPVVKGGTPQQIIDRSFRRSSVWPHLQILALTQNMRVRQGGVNGQFAEWIQSLPYDEAKRGRIELFPAIRTFQSADEFFLDVYPDTLLQNSISDYSELRGRSILTIRNESAWEINECILRRLPGQSREYYSADKVVADAEDEGLSAESEVTPELLQSFNCPSLPQSLLRLKIGAPIMLIRNLYASEGLCNGTRMQVTSLTANAVYATIIGGRFDGQKRVIPRIKLTSSPGDLPFVIERTQFPIRVCYAMTINKSQGQSFDTVAVDLRSDVFSHGQFYVAMSRVTDVNRLTVLLPRPDESGSRLNRVRNIVYPEALIRQGAAEYGERPFRALEENIPVVSGALTLLGRAASVRTGTEG